MSKSLEWSELDGELIPWIREAIQSFGFEKMTPVQAATIPLFSKNKDVIVEAVTGSGKTLSFVIPIVEKLMRQDSQQLPFFALVISPTRELSLQIEKVFQSLLKFNPIEDSIKTQSIIGGINSLHEDVENYKKNKPQIIIATPGRLLEFINLNISIKNLEILILDEADKLLDLNFNKEMNKILPILPKQKRIGLFSATILNATENFYKTSMRNPIKILVNSKNHKPNSLNLYYHILKPEDKLFHLLNFLNDLHFRKSIIYFPTCISVEYFYTLLNSVSTKLDLNLSFYSLHGKLKTSSRIKTLDKFANSDNSKSVLLTTDVASRGIDIENVDLVIQIDPPTDPDVFLHRCGRTGRANNKGQAVVFLNEGREEDYIDFLNVRKIELNELKLKKESINRNKFNSGIKEWILEDRLRHDKAILSYVSFIRYYSKHTASSIFRLQTLDYLSLAKMYSILRLPKMPEIKQYLKDSPNNGIINEEINFNEYKYLNPKKEEERLIELKNEDKKMEALKKKKQKAKENTSWSKKNGVKDEKSEKFLQRELKKRKKELEFDDDNDDQETDWKDLVKRSKKEKKDQNQGIAQFDDL